MATTTLNLAWVPGDDGDYIATTDHHELVVYPPSPTGRAFWFVTTLTTSQEVATGFADALADAKDDAAYAARCDAPLWSL